eukprot:2306251-Rhodomonas_salina.1
MPRTTSQCKAAAWAGAAGARQVGRAGADGGEEGEGWWEEVVGGVVGVRGLVGLQALGVAVVLL